MKTETRKVALMYDFDDGKGPVPAHQHPKGGGWVAKTAVVDPTVYVGPNAMVYGRAQVRDLARLEDESHACDDARVSGHVILSGNTWIFEKAKISGLVQVRNTRVCGNVHLSGHQVIVNHPMMS